MAAESAFPKVRINWTWFILAILILWTLAFTYFPSVTMNLSTGAYWLMALAGLIGIVVSIVLHEMSHSLMASRFGLGARTITLFVFGGVADLRSEPTRPGAEFWIAAVGPFFSFLFGIFFSVVEYFGVQAGWSQPVTDVARYLARFNLVVAYFNMLPAFPLDGGRIFRSAVWAWTGDVKKATRIASGLSRFFAYLLIVLGVLQALAFTAFGVINGVWLIFLGIFLNALTSANYLHAMMSNLLERETVARAMKRDQFSVHPETSLREFVDDVYKHQSKLLPVTDEREKLVGLAEFQGVKAVPEGEWSRHQVREIVEPKAEESVVSPRDAIMPVLERLKNGRHDELIVADQGRVVGRISVRDIMDFFTLKMELEGRAV